MEHHTKHKAHKPVMAEELPEPVAEPVAVDPAVAAAREAKIAAGLKLPPSGDPVAVVRATHNEQLSGSFGGFLDFLEFLKPDWTKANKPKFKQGTEMQIDALKPATTWPGDFDDSLWDMLKGALNKYIDGIGVPVPLVVGDPIFTAADVDAYLSGFPGVSDEVRQKLKRRPRTLGLLKNNFTHAEQAKIVGNPFLLGLLSILGPLILEFLKRWLSKE